ncbi:MAG: dockerin type I repeat-containing protein, partial [Prevotellaceae bacterium]|nr:dockerin type I repeat-containing protein [Candidatus Colivivens caballi]
MIKRLLLVSAAAVIATSSFAQKKAEKVHHAFDAQAVRGIELSKDFTKSVVSTSVKSISPRTSFATGTYYEVPSGLLYYGFNEEGSGYYPTYFCAPAWSDVKFPYNYTKSKFKPTWKIAYPASTTSDAREYGIEYWGEDNQTDSIVTFYGFGTMSIYAMPTMTLGVQDFRQGDDNKYYKKNDQILNENYYPRLRNTYEISPLTNFDAHSAEGYRYYGTGACNGYLYGSGEMNGTLISSVFQEMGTTLAPLYIESAFCSILSRSANAPMPEGTQLTLTYYNPETLVEYGSMALTTDNLLPSIYNGEQESVDTDEYGTWYYHDAHFANLVEDEFGNMSEEPIVIDGPWAIEVSGLDQEGVDVGFIGAGNSQDNIMPEAYFVVGEHAYHYTSEPLSMFFTFNAMYDKSVIVTEAQLNDGTEIKDLNVFKVSDDGQSISCGSFADLDYVWVKTAAPWYGYDYDENDEFFIFNETNADQEFYYLDVAEGEEYPEWVTSYAADVQDWANDDLDEYGAVYLTFQCEPLPAGVKGRKAELYVYGRGCVSDEPIVLIQGEVEEEEPLAGDANSDGAVNVSDISAVASYILGDAPEAFNEANADANGDSEINVGDISAIANFILNGSESNAKTILASEINSATLTLSADEVVAGQEFELNVDLNNAEDPICGVQADIYLPAGLEFVTDEYDDPVMEGGRSTKITTSGA